MAPQMFAGLCQLLHTSTGARPAVGERPSHSCAALGLTASGRCGLAVLAACRHAAATHPLLVYPQGEVLHPALPRPCRPPPTQRLPHPHADEILHLVLETLTAAVKAAPEAAVQWEQQISGAAGWP